MNSAANSGEFATPGSSRPGERSSVESAIDEASLHDSTEMGHAPPPDAPLPELTPPTRVDKWAHRRVEPRGLALVWTLYLLGVTMVCFWTPALSTGLDALSGRYSARLVLVAVGFGMAVLWPMLRLCQTFPNEGGLRGVGKDLVVMIIPTQAVIWPLAFLALWPLSVAACVAASSLGWTLVVGALLAMALGGAGRERQRSSFRRIAWMVVILAVAARPSGMYVPPIAVGDVPSSDVVDLWSMLSAVSAPLSMTVPPQGRAEWLLPGHWAAVGVTWALAGGLWLVAAALVGGGPARHPKE
ncbi:MAG: hypothetical protein HEQ23_12525 [Tepidisphaera sp.]